MKFTVITNIWTFIFVFLLIPFNLFPQSDENKIEKDYKWEKEDVNETIKIEIPKGSSHLMLAMSSTIENGSLKVYIKDPDGNKEVMFNLESDGKSKSKDSDDEDYDIEIKTESEDGKSVGTAVKSHSSTVTTTMSSGSNSSSSSSSNSNSNISTNKGGNSYSYSTTTSVKGSSKAVISEVLSKPKAGTWEIVIEAKKVTGELEIDVKYPGIN